MQTLTFFNHVGGAGKTSLVRDIGYELSTRGLRVLLIDLDPQANLSSALGVSTNDLAHTVYPTVIEDAALSTPVQVHGLSLIPANVELAMAEAQMPGVVGAQLALRTHLATHANRLDVVLIDSPPSLGALAVLGALAADQLVIPVPTKDKGLLGLAGVQRALRMYRRLRPDLSIGLYIPTMYDRRALHDRETLETIRSQLSPVASEMSLRGAVWNDSWRAQQPVRLFDPSSDVVAQVQRVTDELIQAVGLPVEVAHG